MKNRQIMNHHGKKHWVLIEKHTHCNCTYCDGTQGLHYGLQINHMPHGWSIIKLPFHIYIRWT